MKKYLISCLVVVLFISCKTGQISQNTTQSPLTSLDEKIKHLHTPNENYVLVAAHRGDWRHAPENSIQAIVNAIDMGVDIVEVDIQKTKDGHLVLMHDNTIDRASTGHGKVADYTLAEIREFRLKNGLGRETHHPIPTFEEAMLAAKGKAIVNLDKCYDIFDDVYQVLKKTGTTKQVIMKGSVTVEQLKKDYGQYLSEVPFMPVINLTKDDAPQIIADYEAKFPPVAYEFVFPDTNSSILNDFQAIRQSGSRVWVNSLWASLSGGYEDDLAIAKPDSIYGWHINKGANVIQTDRPEFLLNYLRSKGLHK